MKISSIISYTVALISVKGAVTVMLMDDMLMNQNLESFLAGLVQYDQLSEEHKLDIIHMAVPPPPPIDVIASNTTDNDAGDSSSTTTNLKEHYRDAGFTTPESKELLRDYLYNTVNGGTMLEETAEEIASSLNLGGLHFTEEEEEMEADSLALVQGLNGPAPADYQDEGNMQRVGMIKPVVTSGSSFVNGIWGYATPNGAREYALMCAGAGLSIVDVTNAAQPFRVQFTPMSGGGIWRDACTHKDAASGITYAYVAAQGFQGGGNKPNLFVFNLSWLSDNPNEPNGKDSNPIPKGGNGYIDLGETDFGHTINCARGLLFIHTAYSSQGCRVYDISQNPTKPKLLFTTAGKGGCHDSMVQTNMDVNGQKRDLWFISEAFGRRDSIRDITAVNSKTKSIPPLIGSTPAMSGIYAHSSVLYKNRYLFQTDENNQHDISIYDINNIGNPRRISRFMHSEHNSFDAITHNGFIRGNYYYIAYYQAGLRVFDISNPHSVYEVGKVETHRDPYGDGKFINVKSAYTEGAWNVYVDLPSKNILVNDMSNGLFIVKADAPYAKPASPVLKADRDNSSNVKLSWNKVANARGYSVERSFNGSTYTRLGEYLAATATSFVDNGARNKSALYRIIAVNGEGEGTSNTVHSKVKGDDKPPLTHEPTHKPTHKPTNKPTQKQAPPPTKKPTNRPTSGSGGGGVGTPSSGGAQTASYNQELGVPSCAMGSSCDTLSLLNGRHNLGPEVNQPNTLDNCSDGVKGKYHSDESVDKIVVSSNSGEDMKEASTVTVNARVFCFDDGKKDFIYFFHTSDATNPSWTLKGRVKCTGKGIQTLSTSYQLPAGNLQAVRVSIRYEEGGNSSQKPCFKGNYVDTDDVAFQVKGDQPAPATPPTTRKPTLNPTAVKVPPTPPPTHKQTAPPTHKPTPKPTSGSGGGGGGGTPSNGGPQTASYNQELGAPSCATGSSCDTLSLLDGRHNLGPEVNQPNTLDNCADGGSGKYHFDESIDAITITSNSGEDMKEGSTVTVKTRVFCFDKGKDDYIYFFHTADATNPSWTLKRRVQCPGKGVQTVSASYQLPAGNLQAVRASIRYEESGDSNNKACFKGNHVDTDDVAFLVKGNQPAPPAPTRKPTIKPTAAKVPPTPPPTHQPLSSEGAQIATYNQELGVPSCAVGSSCDTKSLLNGRHNLGPEVNQPNTLDNCSDGVKGKYHSDESIDAIFISSNSGEDMKEGSTVTVNAGVFCYDNGKNDFIYFFHTADATNPSWTLKGRVKCGGGGIQTVSASFQLAKGSLQAVRASIRYEEDGHSSGKACFKGNYVDTDDVAIQVKENPSFQGLPNVEEVEIDVGELESDHLQDEREEQLQDELPDERKQQQHERGLQKRKKLLRRNGSRQ